MSDVRSRIEGLISRVKDDVYNKIDSAEDQVNDLKDEVASAFSALNENVGIVLDEMDTEEAPASDSTKARASELNFLGEVLSNPGNFQIQWVSNNLVSDPHYTVRSQNGGAKWLAEQNAVCNDEFQGEKSGPTWDSLQCDDVTLHKIPLNMGTIMRELSNN